MPDRFAQLKRSYVEGREVALTRSWERLLVDLDREIEVVKKFGSDVCCPPRAGGIFFFLFFIRSR